MVPDPVKLHYWRGKFQIFSTLGVESSEIDGMETLQSFYPSRKPDFQRVAAILFGITFEVCESLCQWTLVKSTLAWTCAVDVPQLDDQLC